MAKRATRKVTPELSAPIAQPSQAQPKFAHGSLVGLAREAVVGSNDLATALSIHGLTLEDWQHIQRDPEFIRLVAEYQQEIAKAGDIESRVRSKSRLLLEEWVTRDAPRILFDQRESGATRTKAVELLKGIAGDGFSEKQPATEKQSVSVVINIGTDEPLKFVGEKIINHESDGGA